MTTAPLPARPVLAGVVVLMTVGSLARTWGGHGPLFDALFVDAGMAEGRAELAVSAGGVLVLVAALVAGASRGRSATIAALLVCLWMLAQSLAALHQEEVRPWWEPAEHAVRFVAPLGLAFMGEAGYPRRAGPVLLRLAAAATFIGHGVAAWCHEAAFLDYLYRFFALLGSGLGEGEARALLTAIGVLDVAVGVAVLVRPWSPALAWMALWGVVTACARLLFPASEGWPETLVRAPNGGVPLVAWLALRSHDAPCSARSSPSSPSP